MIPCKAASWSLYFLCIELFKTMTTEVRIRKLDDFCSSMPLGSSGWSLASKPLTSPEIGSHVQEKATRAGPQPHPQWCSRSPAVTFMFIYFGWIYSRSVAGMNLCSLYHSLSEHMVYPYGCFDSFARAVLSFSWTVPLHPRGGCVPFQVVHRSWKFERCWLGGGCYHCEWSWDTASMCSTLGVFTRLSPGSLENPLIGPWWRPLRGPLMAPCLSGKVRMAT
jgi:hypothetical protein